MKYNRKLTNLLINPKYQLRYIAWISLTGILLVGVYMAVFYRFTQENYSILVDLSPMDDATKAQLYHELYTIIFTLGALGLCFIFLVAVLGLFISHKTAGPMFKFRKIFKEISNGNRAARIILRPGDDFQDVATAFNEMMDQLESKK